MGLTSSLLIGQSALSASQIALQVTGNNIANVATPGYHRQSAMMGPIRGSHLVGRNFVGSGVAISDIRRAIDPAITARLRASISDEQAAMVDQSVLLQLESLTNELTGVDLSSELSKFFNAFSELSNSPGSTVARSSVVEQGASLATFVRSLRTDMVNMRNQIDTQIRQNVDRADELLSEIATLNLAIISAEQGRGTESNLRDQRDSLIAELSGIIDVTVVEQANGAADILVGSQPIVLAGKSRGLVMFTESTGSTIEVEVRIRSSQERVAVGSGRIGSLLGQRDGSIQQSIRDLDQFASTLMFEVNKLHTSGRSIKPVTDTTGWLRVPVSDQTLALNDPANGTLANLPFAPKSGSFQVIVRDQNGNESTTTINIDLDGIDATGASGYGDDTTLEGIRAALDAIPNLNAEITPAGELRIYTDSGMDVSFAEDSSGVLAVLGINTYFTGSTAADIGVRQALRSDPLLLNVGLKGDTNETSLAIAALRDAKISSFGGDTLAERWLKTVERTAVQTASAGTRAAALQTVRQSLESQNAAVSGVSLDEEAINLITYQQQYQGAARFVSIVNEMTQILINLV